MYVFERLNIKSSKIDLPHQCNSSQNSSILIESGKMIIKLIQKLNITRLFNRVLKKKVGKFV